MEELLARIRADRTPVGHRPAGVDAGDLRIDVAAREVHPRRQDGAADAHRVGGARGAAPRTRPAGARTDLLHEVWGPGYDRETNYLRTYLGTLRKKLEADPARPEHLITEPGIGYRFVTGP